MHSLSCMNLHFLYIHASIFYIYSLVIYYFDEAPLSKMYYLDIQCFIHSYMIIVSL